MVSTMHHFTSAVILECQFTGSCIAKAAIAHPLLSFSTLSSKRYFKTKNSVSIYIRASHHNISNCGNCFLVFLITNLKYEVIFNVN